MKQLILLLLSVSVLIACKTDREEEIVPSSDVFIRIENESGFTYTDILLNNTYEYGSLNSGETSEYQLVEWTYENPDIELKIEGNDIELRHSLYPGETGLSGGNYTYIVSSNEPGTHIYSRLKED